jgi:16S rRNA (guanine527-N7)-methyltransferase
MPPEQHRAATGQADPLDLAEMLRQGVVRLGLVLDDPTLRKLLDYLGLLRKWNSVYNLTAVRDPAQMLVQHLLDSLAILPTLQRRLDLAHTTIADVGSGAGLPGIPLAIVQPTARVISIEPVGKKSAFQRQVCGELALANVEVYTGRAESIARPVDLVLCRAFASMADFVDAAAGLTGPATVLAAMKGQRAEIDAEIASLPPHYDVTVEPLQVPFLAAERHLVLLGRRPTPAA